MTADPFVSINLCCYNSEKYLRETLDSVVKQTYLAWELIIINDGSTDSTEAIVKEYIGQGYPIVYHYQENRGLGYSRNEALARSRGKYIAFLDHDDVWLPEKLGKQMAVYGTNAGIDLVYTNYYVTRGKRRAIKFKAKQPEGQVFGPFLLNYPVHVSTALARRTAIDKLASYFDPNLQLTEDFDFFMRLIYQGKARYLCEPLATYRYHPGMTSVTQEVRLIHESIHVLSTFSRLAPDLKTIYGGTIEKVIARNNVSLAFKLAKDELARGDQHAARKLIAPYMYSSPRIFGLFIIACFPGSLASRLWAFSLKVKNMITV